MELKNLGTLGLKADSDFRAKATFGVASAALALLFPIAILNFFQGNILTGVGSMGIVTLLGINVWLVYKGRCHQNLTLLCLVPVGMLFMLTVFQDDGIIGSLWCYPSIIACYCMLSERRAWMANLCILCLSLPMIAVTLPWQYSVRVTATLIAISVFSVILVRVIDKLNSKLQHRLVHDPLTELFNRLTLKTKIDAAIETHKRAGTNASLLAVDIDDFKLINDRYGHDVGDKALIEMAAIFRANLRDNDHAFRIGGEEFLILLNGSDEKQANVIAERLRRRIEITPIIPDTEVTVSIGATQYANGETWNQWMKRADNLQYEAKRLGKNRVSIAAKPRLVSINNFTKQNKSTGTQL